MADPLFVGAWYRWFPDDWQGSRKVRRMNACSRGVYRELLDLQWVEGPFAFDPPALARLTGLTAEEILAAWPAISWCFEESDGRWMNLKLEDERDLAASRSERATKGARAKADLERGAVRSGVRSALLEQSPSTCSSPAAQDSGLRTQDSGSRTQEPKREEGASAPAAPPPPSPRKGKPLWAGQIPEPLCSAPGFPEVWASWLAFRKDELRKPVTPRSGDQSLAVLAEMGPARALAAIRHTIANGWQGIREPDLLSSGNSQHTPNPYSGGPTLAAFPGGAGLEDPAITERRRRAAGNQ